MSGEFQIILISISTFTLVVAGIVADRLYEDFRFNWNRNIKIVVSILFLIVGVVIQSVYIINQQDESDKIIKNTKTEILYSVTSTSETLLSRQESLKIEIDDDVFKLQKLENNIGVITSQIGKVKNGIDTVGESIKEIHAWIFRGAVKDEPFKTLGN